MGALDRSRNFILKQKGDTTLPTDLAGVTYIPFALEPKRTLQKRMDLACEEIKASIRQMKSK